VSCLRALAPELAEVVLSSNKGDTDGERLVSLRA
jgi:hypothetical protein